MVTSINRPPLSFITSSFLCVLLLAAHGLSQSVPAMYVFGDSLVDFGNNNRLSPRAAKANFPHYGVDYPTGEATGRFSNGKNAADFLAEKVGLQATPPYLSLGGPNSLLESVDNITMSFASGGAGILDGTDELFGESISLTKQVDFFSVVHDQLLQRLGSDRAQAHLSKSLFLLVIGSNDLFRYFNKNFNASKEYTPQQYLDLMVSTLKGLSKRLYALGARKFVVSGVPVLGCCPALRKESPTSECITEANNLSTKYNDGLKALLQELTTESPDIHYSFFDTYSVTDNIIQHPETYGFTEVKEACCGLGNLKADIPCNPNSSYCPNRKNYLFWDLFHPTEYTSSIFANLIYNGSQEFTTPVNVEQLVNV